MRITETFEELLFVCNKDNKQIFEVAQAEEIFVQDIDLKSFRGIVLRNIIAMRDCITNGLQNKELSVRN